MRKQDIRLCGEYRVKIGDRLAPVLVIAKRERRGQTIVECRTLDTGRTITATAGRLRPVPGTPEAAAERARKEKRIAATPAGTYGPKMPAPVLVAPSPVPGMVERVDPSQPVERLIGHNRQAVARIVAGVHVAMPWSAACRAVYRVIGTKGRLRGFPRALRRGAWLQVAEEHAANRAQYRAVMGHAAPPSEEMITAAMFPSQPGYPGEPPAGVPWESWLAANNVD
jgi:hypothetical protein